MRGLVLCGAAAYTPRPFSATRRSREPRFDEPAAQHRDHCARRSRQDHAGRPAAAAVRHLRFAQGAGRPGDGLECDRTRARDHDPRQEHRDPLAGLPHQHRRHARVTPTSAARSSACCRWSTPCCCSSTRSTDRCRRRASSPRRRFRTGLRPIVVINKIDRPEARPNWVLDQTFDLFDRLGATEAQLDFPVVYTSALQGFASHGPCPPRRRHECALRGGRASLSAAGGRPGGPAAAPGVAARLLELCRRYRDRPDKARHAPAQHAGRGRRSRAARCVRSG